MVAGDDGAGEPEEHEQLGAGTAVRGPDVDGLGATRAWEALGWRRMGEYGRHRRVVALRERWEGGVEEIRGVSGDSRSQEAGGLRLHDGHVFWGVG